MNDRTPAALVFIATLASLGGATIATAQSSPVRQAAPCMIEVRIDSVLAANTNEGLDERLKPVGRQLEGLFPYTTYRLVSHEQSDTSCGKTTDFAIPGGRILHVEPLGVDPEMVAMELMLFQGERPIMTTQVKLRNRGVLMVGGPKYEQGMLIISIGAETTNAPPLTRGAAPVATAAAHR